MSIGINSLINKYGTEIYWLKRKENLDTNTGEVYYTYPDTISLTAIVNSVGGLIMPWLEFGLKIEADLQLFFKVNKNTKQIELEDHIILKDTDKEYKVTNVIKHPNPIDPKYIEVLVKSI